MIQQKKAEEFLFELEPESIDLIVTSPPFGKLRRYTDGADFDMATVVDGMYRALKPGGVVCWSVADQIVNGAGLLVPERHTIALSEKFSIYEIIYWKKHGVPVPTTGRHYNIVERVIVAVKGNKPNALNFILDRPNSSAGRKQMTHVGKKNGEISRPRKNKSEYYTRPFGRRTNVWTYMNIQSSHWHPAKMVNGLANDLIRTFSNPGDTVVDPFVGSGTTVFEAINLGREWKACDKSKEYVDKVNAILNEPKLF
jgi:DNA modification methylase